MADTDDFAKSYQHYQEALKKVNELNKGAVFDVLADEGIERVTITFDGEGDSGQIEELVAYKDGQPVEMPVVSLTLHSVEWGSDTVTTALSALSEAIEKLCYGFLGQEHGGWENNDGAYGDFIFTVAERRIELEFNSRFVDSTLHSYTF